MIRSLCGVYWLWMTIVLRPWTMRNLLHRCLLILFCCRFLINLLLFRLCNIWLLICRRLCIVRFICLWLCAWFWTLICIILTGLRLSRLWILFRGLNRWWDRSFLCFCWLMSLFRSWLLSLLWSWLWLWLWLNRCFLLWFSLLLITLSWFLLFLT